MFFPTTRDVEEDLMCVQVTTDPELQVSEPERLFSNADANINFSKGWAVSADGRRILGVRNVTTESSARRITVVENWYQEFEKP